MMTAMQNLKPRLHLIPPPHIFGRGQRASHDPDRAGIKILLPLWRPHGPIIGERRIADSKPVWPIARSPGRPSSASPAIRAFGPDHELPGGEIVTTRR